jgi:hypothetical protein
VVRGNALAVEHQQVDFGRQRQESRDQQPVEIRRALEQRPHGGPGGDLDAEDLPAVIDRVAEQYAQPRYQRQRQVAEQDEQVGRAEPGGQGRQRRQREHGGQKTGRALLSVLLAPPGGLCLARFICKLVDWALRPVYTREFSF